MFPQRKSRRNGRLRRLFSIRSGGAGSANAFLLFIAMLVVLIGCGQDRPAALEPGDASRIGSPDRFLADIERVNEAIAQNPEDAENYIDAGKKYNSLTNVARGSKEKIEFRKLAKKNLMKAIELDGNNFEAYLGLADYYNTSGPPGYGKDLDKAIKYFQICHEMRPDSTQVLVFIGVCYYRKKKYQEAKEALNKALELAEKQYMETLKTGYLFDIRKAKEHLGRIYTEEGKLDLAEKFLKESTEDLDDFNDKHNATWGCPYQALGRLYSLQKKPKAAVVSYIKAAEEQPFTDHMQYKAALHLCRAQYYDQALIYINRALKISDDIIPRLIKLWIIFNMEWAEFRGNEMKTLNLAIVQDQKLDPGAEFLLALDDYQQDRFDDAMIRVNRILERENYGPAMVLKGFLYLFQKRYDEAGDLFESARNERHTDFGAEVGLGHLKIIQKHYFEAEKDFLGALKIGDTTFGDAPIVVKNDEKYLWFCYEMANLGMGWVQANRNCHDIALSYIRRILEAQPNDLMAQLARGNSLIGMKRFAEAEKLYDQLLQTHPGDPFAMAQLALTKYNLGKENDAEELFLKAQNAGDPTYTCPYEGLGLVYLKQGKLDKAKKNFKKAIELDPDIQFKKYNGLAKIYMKEGKNAKAATLLKKSIGNYPHDNEAVILLEKCAQILCEAKDAAGIDSFLFLAGVQADHGEPQKACRSINHVLSNITDRQFWSPKIVDVAIKLREKGFIDEYNSILFAAEKNTLIPVPDAAL